MQRTNLKLAFMKQIRNGFTTNIDYSNNYIIDSFRSYMDSIEFVKKLVEQTMQTLESEESNTL